jgi:hypothetical protein
MVLLGCASKAGNKTYTAFIGEFRAKELMPTAVCDDELHCQEHVV